MDQIFQQYLPFSLGGLLLGAGMWKASNTHWAHCRSGSFVVLAIVHSGFIMALYLGRENMGEGYAYLIYGALLTILIGVLAGILFLTWGTIFLMKYKHEKRKRLELTADGTDGALCDKPNIDWEKDRTLAEKRATRESTE